MLDCLDEFMDGDFDAEFLTQFADEAGLKAFIMFPLATGKFPKATQVCVSMPLSDEQFTIAKDQTSADFNDRLRVQG